MEPHEGHNVLYREHQDDENYRILDGGTVDELSRSDRMSLPDCQIGFQSKIELFVLDLQSAPCKSREAEKCKAEDARLRHLPDLFSEPSTSIPTFLRI
jgi:hypothetical protein